MARKPSIEEVLDYSEEWNLNFVEPQEFYDYYEENGWERLRSWRMALKSWDKKAMAAWDAPEPTWEEVEEYALQNNLEFVDAEEFYIFYATNAGWGTVGDWREAMKAWDRKAENGWN